MLVYKNYMTSMIISTHVEQHIQQNPSYLLEILTSNGRSINIDVHHNPNNVQKGGWGVGEGVMAMLGLFFR